MAEPAPGQRTGAYRVPPQTRTSPPVTGPGAPGQGDRGHPYELPIPRQAGPVSSPFMSPAAGGPGDKAVALDQRRAPAPLPDAGPPPGFAAPDIDAPGTDLDVLGTGSHRRRTPGMAVAPRPGSRRAVTQAKGRAVGRRSGGIALSILTGPARWRWLAAVIVAIVAVAVAAVTLLGGGPDGPMHTLVTPARLGVFTRSTQLAKQMDVSQLEKSILAQSSGQTSHLVSAVYQDGSATVGGPAPQEMLFIGGRSTNASPPASVKSFTQHFKDASLTGAGRLGGDAACVAGQPATGGAAVCAWFDNDTFGELVSPNLTAGALANEMRAIRPSIELLAK